MTNVEITKTPIRPKEEIEELSGSFSIGEYIGRSVNMYGGESVKLTLECSEKIAKDVHREFGEEIRSVPVGENRFRTEVYAAEGEGLIRWLMQFSAEDLKVLVPESIIDAIKERAEEICSFYK